MYAVLPLLKNASDLVHPQPSYCPNSSLSEGVPVLSTSEFSLSIPSRTRPCEASALTRPPKRCYRGRRRLHAGKCHGQGAVPCPLAGAARTAEAQPLLLADDARGRGPPLSQGASAGGGSFSGKSASLFRASFSFSRPLKVGAPRGPALGPPSCRNSPGTAGCHAFHFPRDARAPSFHVRPYLSSEPLFTEHLCGPRPLIRCPSRAERCHYRLILQEGDGGTGEKRAETESNPCAGSVSPGTLPSPPCRATPDGQERSQERGRSTFSTRPSVMLLVPTPAIIGLAIHREMLTRSPHARRGRTSWPAERHGRTSLRDLRAQPIRHRDRSCRCDRSLLAESEPAQRPPRWAPSSRTCPRRRFPSDASSFSSLGRGHPPSCSQLVVHASPGAPPGPFGQRHSGFPSLLSPGTLPSPTSHTAGCHPVPTGRPESTQETQASSGPSDTGWQLVLAPGARHPEPCCGQTPLCRAGPRFVPFNVSS